VIFKMDIQLQVGGNAYHVKTLYYRASILF
jgi:hypothetical protein